MRGVLPMYSCCLRALAKQATSTSRQYVAAEAQTADAVNAVTHTHRLFHTSPARAYSNPATSTPQASTSAASSSFPAHNSRATSSYGNGNGNDANAMHYQPSAEQVTSHLNTLLEGLQPPLAPELAMRMVTHKGSSSSIVTSSQHNTKLSLIGVLYIPYRCASSLLTLNSSYFPTKNAGRRVLRLYLAVFLHAHSSPAKATDSTMNDILERLAHTHTLGRYVAPRWNLERNMHWRQMVSYLSRYYRKPHSSYSRFVHSTRWVQMEDQLD